MHGEGGGKMATTLEDLEKRVGLLENRVKILQQRLDEIAPDPPMPAHVRDIPMLRQAYLQQAAVSAAAEETLKKMGITIDPAMTHEEFKKIRDAQPIPPEEEWASREIMRMREE
jgi:hypothetical protein